MAVAEPAGRLPQEAPAPSLLASQWRQLTRAATIVAVLTSPALFVWFKQYNGWSTFWSFVATVGTIIAFRGVAELVFRRLIPSPSLFGHDSPQLREEDVIARRRAWFWRFWLRLGIFLIVVNTIVWLLRGGSWGGAAADILSGAWTMIQNPLFITQVVFVLFLFIANFAILLGPLLAMNLTQVRGFEPGDAEWGVRPRRTCVGSRRRKRRCGASSRSGSQARHSSAPAASASAG